jgi:hypothetical protein
MAIMILIILLFLIIILDTLVKKTSIIETLDASGSDYQDYKDLEQSDQHGPMLLGLKNAANISSLHTQLSGLTNVKQEIMDISGQVQINRKALSQLGKQISNLSYSSIGGEPAKGEPLPTVTGLN